MPQLPRIEPGSTPITNASPNRRLDPIAESQPGRDVAKMGQAVANLGFRLQEAQNVQEKTKAENQLSQDINRINTEAANDPDFSKERQAYYDSQLRKAKDKASGLIAHPRVRGLFAEGANSSVAISSAKIQDNFRTKMISQGQADANIFIDNKKREAAATNDPAAKNLIHTQVDAKLLELKLAGYITAKEYAKRKIDYKDDFIEFEFQSDIQLEPIGPNWTAQDNVNKLELARQKLASGAYGFSIDKQVKAEESLERAIKRAKTEETEARITQIDANTADFSEKNLIDMTVTEMIEFNDRTPIDPQVLNDTIEWKMNPKEVGTNVETEKDIYTELARNVSEPMKLIKDTRRMISKGMKDGDITSNDALNLNVLLNRLGEEAVNHKTKDGGFIRAIQSSFERINKAAALLGGGAMAYEGVKSIVEGITQGKIKTPEDVKDQADKVVKGARLIANPEIANASEKGQLMMDANGNKAIVYPDGTIEEVK